MSNTTKPRRGPTPIAEAIANAPEGGCVIRTRIGGSTFHVSVGMEVIFPRSKRGQTFNYLIKGANSVTVSNEEHDFEQVTHDMVPGDFITHTATSEHMLDITCNIRCVE